MRRRHATILLPLSDHRFSNVVRLASARRRRGDGFALEKIPDEAIELARLLELWQMA
jgi:hypothetical protein